MNTSFSSQQLPFDERQTTSTVAMASTTTAVYNNNTTVATTASNTLNGTNSATTLGRQKSSRTQSVVTSNNNQSTSGSINQNNTNPQQQQQQPPPPQPPLRASHLSSLPSSASQQGGNTSISTSNNGTSANNTTASLMHQPHGAPAIGPTSYPTSSSHQQQQLQQQHHQQYYAQQQQPANSSSVISYMNPIPTPGGSMYTSNTDHTNSSNAGAGGGVATTSPLPPIVLRSLGDRSNEKRKNAALEIEALIKLLTESNNFGTINAIIMVLSKDFCTSMNSNYRKGGLVGLAATAIGLHTTTQNFLHILLPPVLHCFDDPESRVRYYACESIYNMAKVTRQGILLYFHPIFDGLTKLFADVDVDVKNGANLLDRLIKDIVTEADSDTFQVDQFLPIMQSYIRRTNPYIRQLIVGWITLLDSLPDLSLLDYLPDFLDGLLNMLSDSNREIRQAADSALSDFLRELSGSRVLEFGPIISILVLQCQSKERLIRLTSITWLAELSHHPLSGGDAMLPFLPDILSAILYCINDLEKEIRLVAERTNDDLLQLVRKTQGEFELRPLLETLINELLEKDDVPTKMASLRWINMLKEKRMHDMHSYTESLLPVLLRTLSDPSDAVVLLDLQILSRISLAVASNTNDAIVTTTAATTAPDALEEPSTIVSTTMSSESNHLLAANNVDKEEKNSDAPVIPQPQQQEAQFQLVLNAILNLFAQDRQLLETRGSLIIRKLCVLLNAKAVYIRMAETLSSYEIKSSNDEHSDIDHPETSSETIKFISTMVQTLNLILLTASELHDLRTSLANSFIKDPTFVAEAASIDDDEKDGKVFQTIFHCWCHNPIATFSLCLLAKAYDLSFKLVQRFSEMRDVTVGFLMQIDKLVYLLESPIFIHLRLQLLNVESPYHAQLLKSLYGILMCLPQGEAFRLLNDRLTTVCNLRDNLGYGPFPIELNHEEGDLINESTSVLKPSHKVVEKLLERFDSVTERHRLVKDLIAHKGTAFPLTSEIGSTTSNVEASTTSPTVHPRTVHGNSNTMPLSLYKSATYDVAADRHRIVTTSSKFPSTSVQSNSATTDAFLSRHPVHSFTSENMR